MRLRAAFFRVVACVCLLTGGALTAHALSLVKDGPPLRKQLMVESHQLFLAEKFADLEKRADGMRREQSRLPEGMWELGFLYGGIVNGPEKTPDRTEQFARLDRWQQAMPNSITARIARAKTLVAYAWDARGTSFADAMTKEGKPVISQEQRRLFAERLAMAHARLETDPALRQCPVYYSTMLVIAKGEGWSHAATERLYREGIALAPDFEALHFAYTDYLQPKWYGESPRDWLRSAEQVADALKEKGGAGVYARLVWSKLPPTRVNAANFAQSGIDWPRLRAGFEDLAKASSQSAWNKNAFCYYAWAAGDRETAKRLFAELDGDYAKEIWRTRDAYKKARTWAE